MKNFNKNIRLGDILVFNNEITQEQLKDALNFQKVSKMKLRDILVEKNYTSDIGILNVLSKYLGIKIVNLDEYEINIEAIKYISESLAKRTNSIPINMYEDKILIAMNDPFNIINIEDIKLESRKNVEIVLATKVQINNAIEQYMSRCSAEKAVEDYYKENLLSGNLKVLEEIDDKNIINSPVVRLINSLIRQALKMDSSDIHIEPLKDRIRVRFRIDGELQEIISYSKQTQSAILTRIKIIAGMNIAESRLPQDGRIEIKIDDFTIDLRISVFPTVYGEKIVMRILNRDNFLKPKEELGFTNYDINIFESIIKFQNGVILIVGPTGSGKTTTLYSVLNDLNNINKNIITIEDPVEYKLEGVNQVQVNAKAGLNFASGLRSILRQDPDIIMIGEIRDEESAEIAIRSAITGHLVVSTLHTNDAPSTIIRLQDMGIKPYLLNAALRGVVAQRLVKKICRSCKYKYIANAYENELLEIDGKVALWKGKGCPKCHNTGYCGRIAIYEIMKVDESIRNVISKRNNIDDIEKIAKANGMITLKDNCKKLVMSGITTVDEYLQVLFRL